jgi:hypothetical protein
VLLVGGQTHAPVPGHPLLAPCLPLSAESFGAAVVVIASGVSPVALPASGRTSRQRPRGGSSASPSTVTAGAYRLAGSQAAPRPRRPAPAAPWPRRERGRLQPPPRRTHLAAPRLTDGLRGRHGGFVTAGARRACGSKAPSVVLSSAERGCGE